jgi:LAGLIDADG endonuclease
MVSLEYIAGFFDGEGFISIQKASHKSHSGSRYWLIASITNIHKGVMEEIQKVVGGKILFYNNNYTQNKGCGYHHRLTLYSKQAYVFIQTVLPYLVVKKEQALIAIKYQESHRSCGSGRGLSVEELVFQEDCYNQLRLQRKNEKELV